MSDIPKGALLLVEQVMTGSAKDLVAMIAANAMQYNSLCPRDDVGDRNVLAYNKLEANCFHFQNQVDIADAAANPWYCVGNSLSCFNHRCSPSAIVHQVVWHSPKVADFPVVFFVVYAFTDIVSGEEVCISYGKIIGHSKKQKPEIRCRDPDCMPAVRSIPLEKSARAGLDEHWVYLKAFVKSDAFKHGLVYRKMADDGCHFVGGQENDSSSSLSLQLHGAAILNRKFLKANDGSFSPASQSAFVREKFDQILSRVSVSLDRIDVESVFH